MVLELGEKYIRFHTQGQTLLDDDGDPYEVETPYLYDDIEGIHYVQSADIVTLVHQATLRANSGATGPRTGA